MDCRKLLPYLKCFLCWDCCCNVSDVKAEIIGHLTMTAAMTISILVLMLPPLEPHLSRLPCCQNGTHGIFPECEDSASSVVVLRFSFVFTLFWVLSFCYELTARKSENFLTHFASSSWFLKIFAITSGCAATLYIGPNSFDKAWTVFLGLGSVVFIVVQLYTVIRLSYVLIVVLHRMAERGSKSAKSAQLALFIAGIVLSVAGEGVLIYYYPLCNFNIAFLLTNALIPAVACLWSISSCVKERNGFSGFIQGSILNCFVVYYTWSAFTNESSPACNPYFKPRMPYLSLSHVVQVMLAFVIYIINLNFTYVICVDDLDDSRRDEIGESNTIKPWTAADEGYRSRVYNSIMCSYIRGPMICFIVMTCMEWSPASAGSDTNKTNNSAMWFKLVACWLSIIFFIVTLYTPQVYGIRSKMSLLQRR